MKNSTVTAIDLFAGAGGFSMGARMAGAKILWAGNHWPAAVGIHKLNHSDAIHVCQDLHQARWDAVPEHDILLASPCCQGHSRARGKAHGNPQHDASRSTAWAVVSALEFHRPPAAIVENVPEFMQWSLFQAWCQALVALGYAIAPHVVDAADHGVPQNRKRLFIVLTRSQHPMELQFPKRAHVPASTIIDWSSGKWSKIDRPGRSPATLARIRNGRAVFGDRFLTPYYGSGSGKTGRSIDRPIGTITTFDRWALIDGDRMRMLSVTEARRAMGFPDDYILPAQAKAAMMMLGNAVAPPVARDFIEAIRRAA